MKIRSIRPVRVKLTGSNSGPKSIRKGWAQTSRRGYPISFYDEFPREPTGSPGYYLGEVWVQVTAEDGTFGIGQCSNGAPVAAYIRSVLAPLLEGRDCMAIEHLNDLALRTAHRVGRIGTASNAMSGVDLALWDLKGKLLGRPVYELLGGPVKDELTCYITTDDLEWAQELGFQKFKISNPTHYSDGDAGIKSAVEHVASSRKKVGDEADLMINPVMSFNVEYALRMLEELKPFHLRWFEEPLPPTNIEGLQTLREAAPWVTIATGEDHYGRHEFLRIVESRGADILQPDIKWCGGLSECVKIHAIGEAAGVTTILHAGANNPYGQHFAMAATESPMGEYFQASDPGIPLNESQRLPGMATPVNGKITVSDAPGFGIDVTESDVTDWEDTGRGALA